MRENNGNSSEKKMIGFNKEESNTNNGFANIANVSTDISPDKNQISP
jgi:hypothetical protein